MCAARLKALHRQISTGGSVGLSVRSDTSSNGEQVKGEEPGAANRPKILSDLTAESEKFA